MKLRVEENVGAGTEGDDSTAEVKQSKQKQIFFFSPLFLNMNQM